ncbi:MAG: MlaD family protein [Bdellovibrionales bacterium]
MKIKFNKFEKVAGMFVGLAILGSTVGLIGIAIKNGWLSSKVRFATELESADGVHAGTVVQISGLRVGSVTSVELESNDRVRVEFDILEKFVSKVREDSVVQMYRPFILSEKVLDVTVGSEESPMMKPGALLVTQSSSDVMDLLSGRKMTQMMAAFDSLSETMKILGDSFANPERTRGLVQMLDRLNPLVDNLNEMSKGFVKIADAANRQKRVEVIVDSLAQISKELKTAVPAFTKEVPDMGTQMGQIVKNLNVLASEFQKLTPAISAVAPELPRTSRRAVEALDEAVVLLKAMQRSFLLRGKVDEVREEEGRRPANTSEP